MKMFVLIRRGLYYRPGAMGYTGLLREAGRFSGEECVPYLMLDGQPTICRPVEEADRFAPECDQWIVNQELAREAEWAAGRHGLPRASEHGVCDGCGVVGELVVGPEGCLRCSSCARHRVQRLWVGKGPAGHGGCQHGACKQRATHVVITSLMCARHAGEVLLHLVEGKV